MKKKILSVYQQLVLPDWSVPLILLGVSFVTFGLLTPNLGFYMDDWPYIHYAYTRGIESLKDMLFYDSRPFAGWLYILAFRLLGFKPLAWHISTLILRWIATLGLWLSFRVLWKDQKELALYTALLFSVYPYFLMQPLAVGSTHHWVGFSFYAFSLWAMLLSQSKKKWYVPLLLCSLLLEGIHLFTAEYFSGLELLRPFILWILLSRQEENILRRLVRVFLQWLPYLLILIAYAYWRAFIFQGPPNGDRNPPVLLYQFIAEPLQAAFQLLIISLKDSTIILFNSWYQTLEPNLFSLSSFFARLVLIVLFLSFFSLVFLLNKLGKEKRIEEKEAEQKKWRKEAILLGIVALFSGTLPIWTIGKNIAMHKNQMAATRFGIPSMFGAALLLVILLDYFITDRQRMKVAISLVVTLAIGLHLNNAHSYEYSWEKQVNLYQQLVQRIPDMEPNTALVSAGEVLFYMGDYPTSYALNSIYTSSATETPYWFFALYSNFPGQFDDFFAGMPLQKQHLLSEFSGRSEDILFISYEPERGQCLWVLRPEDANLRLISQVERQASLNSAIDRIQIAGENLRVLPPEIFGEDIPENWCSFYQRADLARQRENWIEVTRLWEDALDKDKRPENGFEYIPFIEGYAYQEKWQDVKKLTRQAKKVSQGMEPTLCSTLSRLEERTLTSPLREEIVLDLTEYLDCER
ncbi:MAG: hypothetical protein GY755_02755 [Chloroflexi bacterium]|nr:hypothetical protein [Chloroflexota bacterium]